MEHNGCFFILPKSGEKNEKIKSNKILDFKIAAKFIEKDSCFDCYFLNRSIIPNKIFLQVI